MRVERNLFVFQNNTCQPETLFFEAARDLIRTEESALLVPQVKLLGAFEIRPLETCRLAIG